MIPVPTSPDELEISGPRGARLILRGRSTVAAIAVVAGAAAGYALCAGWL
jgi:hypothetical protein